jgi:hypothetical protein
VSADEVTRAVDLLVGQVAHWLAPRWAAPTADGRSRGDVVYGLVQRMADRVAEAEGGPRRPVPRLAGDLVLPDQLRVMAADLVAAAPSPQVLAAAAADVAAVRRAL